MACSTKIVQPSVLALVILAASGGCATSGFPWPRSGPAVSATRADVVTLNRAYRRGTSQVLVRRVTQPTRASLDYAAYHANFMNADPDPEGAETLAPGQRPSVASPFAGVIVPASLCGSVAKTALTAEERAHPLALPPLVELLVSKKITGGDRLEDVVARVRAENWGLPGGPQFVRQTATELFLHDPGQGRPAELWLKIEFAPWFVGFPSPPDEDGDGVAEIYGRAADTAIGPTGEIAKFIRAEYEARVFSPAEVKSWAHQLASYWYPSYNTDLVAATEKWPTSDTEAEVLAELDGATFSAPTVVMRGKPQGKPVYNVFLVGDGAPAQGAPASETTTAATAALKLGKSKPSPDPAEVKKAVQAELATHGRSWAAWAAEVAPFQAVLKRRLKDMPPGAKAVAGSDGFLFFRQSLAYMVSGDLAGQKGDRNPIPAIVAWKKLLAKHGVDFLFVPVPTKEEVFPDKIGDASVAGFAGKIVNPYGRKLLLDLAEQGVETVDLLTPFLADRNGNPEGVPKPSRDAPQPAKPAGSARDRKAGAGQGALYQAQDTHWTTRGLELAAKLVAERIARYPWYKAIAAHRRSFTTRDEGFTRHGDLVSRLPEAERARFQPEPLVGHQVVNADGSLYEDDPQSPIVVLGDSFTGVYQLMDCEHAGVSAHIARQIGYPVDLVMSYGGGPNVPEKLLRRGEDKLGTKKLVIWMMTARDLYDHAEGWQPLARKGRKDQKDKE